MGKELSWGTPISTSPCWQPRQLCQAGDRAPSGLNAGPLSPCTAHLLNVAIPQPPAHKAVPPQRPSSHNRGKCRDLWGCVFPFAMTVLCQGSALRCRSPREAPLPAPCSSSPGDTRAPFTEELRVCCPPLPRTAQRTRRGRGSPRSALPNAPGAPRRARSPPTPASCPVTPRSPQPRNPQRPHSLGIARTPRQRPLRPGAPHGPDVPRILLFVSEELGPAVLRRGGLGGARCRFLSTSGPFRGAAPTQPPQPLDGHGIPRAPPARTGRGSRSGSSRGRCGLRLRPVPAPEASVRAAEPFPARDAAERSGEEP